MTHFPDTFLNLVPRFLFALAFTVLWMAGAALGHNDPAYSHGSKIGTSHPDWMAAFDDEVRISELSIPGTHETMAFYGGDIAQCQTADLEEQLNAGIRVLDIRCAHRSDTFRIYHGPISQFAEFGEDVIEVTLKFLQSHPSETILMRIRHEDDIDKLSPNSTRPFFETFKLKYFDRYKATNKGAIGIWDPAANNIALADRRNPKLGDIRGKIVIWQNFDGDPKPGETSVHGIGYGQIGMRWDGTGREIQDEYTLKTNWHLHDKWDLIRNFLHQANEGASSRVFVNFLSASGGSFPYFVASGHSSPFTGAPRLATGSTTIWGADYPAFPRVSCLPAVNLLLFKTPEICTIAFEGTNTLTRNHIIANRIVGRPLKRIGIIMADFPGGGLIDEIISLNNYLLPFPVTNVNPSGPGSLKAAVDSGRASVVFDPSLNGQTIGLLDEIVVSTKLKIAGSLLPDGITIARADGAPGRVFNILRGGDLTLERLTVTKGRATGAGELGSGGGIYNLGKLTITGCTIDGNIAGISGGGIYNKGDLNVRSSTISNNNAGIAGGGIGSGGGTLMLGPVTITGNTAGSYGGGLLNSLGLATLNSCTISRNTAPAGSGVASNGESRTRTEVLNSIIAGNSPGGDVDIVDGGSSNTFFSKGHNFIGLGSGTSAFNQRGDTIGNPNPSLGQLGNNGGVTLTLLPELGSPVLDAGGFRDPSASNGGGAVGIFSTAEQSLPPFDQRGFPAVSGIAADIGAVEVSVAARQPVLKYQQNFNGIAEGTRAFGDGSFSAINAAGDQGQAMGAWNEALRLSRAGVRSTLSSFVLPQIVGLDKGFTASFRYVLFRAPENPVSGEGFSLNFGRFSPTTNAGEEGYGNGLSIEVDTAASGAGDIVGYNISVNGADLPGGARAVGDVVDGQWQIGELVDGQWHTIAVQWIPAPAPDDGFITVSLDGRVLFREFATKGFAAETSSRLAFAARTSQLTGEVLIDDIDVSPFRAPLVAYMQNFSAVPDGTKQLDDDSIIVSNKAEAGVISNESLTLTEDGVTNTVSSFILPALRLTASGDGFNAKFNYKMSASAVPADGFSFSYGNITANSSGGEEGFGNGMSLEFDTWDNGDGDVIGHSVSVNGVDLPGGVKPNADLVDGQWHRVSIRWLPTGPETGSLSFMLDDAPLFTDLATPGFAPSAEARMAFGARTGGSTQSLIIDDIEVTEIKVARPSLPGVYQQNFDSFADGVTELGDGTSITTTTPGATGVLGGAFQMTKEGVVVTTSSLVAPALQLSKDGEGFRASFKYRMEAAGTPAQGFSFNYGTIDPAMNRGVEGFGNGLTVALDTFQVNPDEVVGYNVFVNGTRVPGGVKAHSSMVDGQWHDAVIEWAPASFPDNGKLMFMVDDEIVFTDLSTPGFLPGVGAQFAFAAATAGLTLTTLIDDISITPLSGIPPEQTRILTSSGPLNLGNARVGEPLNGSVILTNAGTGPVNLVSITAPNGLALDDWAPGVLPAGASRTIGVTLTPVTEGIFLGTLVVISDATPPTTTIPVTADVAPQSTATPDDPVNLTTYNDRIGQTFQFRITGSTSGTIWGSDVYTDDSPLGVAAVHAGVLSPGQQGLVSVTILPGQERYEGTTRNGVRSTPFGKWQGSYRVEVLPAQETRILTSSGALNLGTARIGETISGSFTLTNAGTGPVVISGITLPAGISLDWTEGTLQAGTSRMIGVSLIPEEAGNYNATIVVNSNATPATTPVVVAATVTPTRVLTSSGPLNLGETTLSQPVMGTLALRNAGTGAVNVSSITTPGGVSVDWTQGTLETGASRAVGVTFTPENFGSFTGTITVNSNATPSAISVVVSAKVAPAGDGIPMGPANLIEYRDRVGQTFQFKVIGSTTGAIWGSDRYTDDSPLAVAAVHAGALTSGQEGVVSVTILPGQDVYESTARNGVTSSAFGPWAGSYRVEAHTPAPLSRFTIVEEGGAASEGNLARGGVAFAKDVINGGGLAVHQTSHLNDGLYGNSFSWIGDSADSFAGISLGATPVVLRSLAFGRSNVVSGDPCEGGVCEDRSLGDYTIQYTWVPSPDATTPDSEWTTIGVLSYGSARGLNLSRPHARHRINFDAVLATGIRIKTPDGAAIDELELYETLGELRIAGTDGDDLISFGTFGGSLEVSVFDGIDLREESFPLSGVPGVLLFGMGGDDQFVITGAITLPTIVDGGAGSDFIRPLFTQTGEEYQIYEGGDNLAFVGGEGTDGFVFRGTPGDDEIIVEWYIVDDLDPACALGPPFCKHDDGLRIRLNGEIAFEMVYTPEDNFETIVVYGGDGNDRIIMTAEAAQHWNAEFYGEGGDDELIGAQRLFFRPRGNDKLYGGPGSDILRGGSGNDLLVGGEGADIIDTGSGENIIVIGVGDVLEAEAGAELDFFLEFFDSEAPVTIAWGDGETTMARPSPLNGTHRYALPGDYVMTFTTPGLAPIEVPIRVRPASPVEFPPLDFAMSMVAERVEITFNSSPELRPGFVDAVTFSTLDHFVQFSDSLGVEANWQSLPGAPHNDGWAIDTGTDGVPRRFYRVLVAPHEHEDHAHE